MAILFRKYLNFEPFEWGTFDIISLTANHENFVIEIVKILKLSPSLPLLFPTSCISPLSSSFCYLFLTGEGGGGGGGDGRAPNALPLYPRLLPIRPAGYGTFNVTIWLRNMDILVM